MSEGKVFRTNLVLVLALFAVYFLHPSRYLLWAAFGLMGVCVFVYPVARAIATGWMTLAGWLGDFNAKVILFILFYLVLTPWAFIVRLMRPDPLLLRETDRETTFRDRNKQFDPEDLERIS